MAAPRWVEAVALAYQVMHEPFGELLTEQEVQEAVFDRWSDG